jgi:hypothetical protein
VFQPPMIVREVWFNILIWLIYINIPTYAKLNYKKKLKQTQNYAKFMSQA